MWITSAGRSTLVIQRGSEGSPGQEAETERELHIKPNRKLTNPQYCTSGTQCIFSCYLTATSGSFKMSLARLVRHSPPGQTHFCSR